MLASATCPRATLAFTMHILFIGDIFASPGRHIVADHLQDIKETNHIDLAIANAENAAGGFGITPSIAEELFSLGLDVLTSGNHIWDKKEIYPYLDAHPDRIIRPANYPPGAPGKGSTLVSTPDGRKLGVLNLEGRVFMKALDDPFRCADEEIVRQQHGERLVAHEVTG